MAETLLDFYQRVVAGLRQLQLDTGELANMLEARIGGEPPPDDIDRMCMGKKAYLTAERAGSAAKSRGVDGLRIYQCPYCGQFHLTSRTIAAFLRLPEEK